MDPRFPTVSNFKIDDSRYEVVRIIEASREAVVKWSTVKDVMVKSAEDNRMIDSHLERKEVYSAIAETLNSWINQDSSKANFHELLGICMDHGFVKLKDDLVSKAVHLRRLELDDSDIVSAGPTDVPARVQSPDETRQPGENTRRDSHQQYHTCPVCLERPWDHLIKCGHFICGECIEKVRDKSPNRFNCRVCREPFGKADVTRAYPPY